MSNIIDYVKWRGDITFSERPFNIIDNLVFCHLVYLDMADAFESRDSMTLREVSDYLGNLASFKLVTKNPDDKKFFELCATSKRYQDIVISNFVDDTNISENKQFAAATFHINQEDSLIVFRGTDATIVGWKEDFMMSYCKVPAQELAYKYVLNSLADNPDQSYYLAGHSKGANLALYAAAHLTDAQLFRVKKVFLNDGPGFCKDVLDTNLITRVDPKCVRITPEYCIVGAIFEPSISKSYIVKSSGVQMMQHGILTWQINENGLDTIQEHDYTSDQINLLFDKFIEKMDDLKNRQAFVNSIFDTMGENGAVTIEDFMKGGPSAFENLIITVIGDNDEGINPLKSVKDNVIDDIKKTPFAQAIKKQFDKKTIFKIVIELIISFLCFKIPQNLIPSVFAFAMFLLVLSQISMTIHHLYKSNWDLNKEKLRVNISIGLIVAYALLIVKDDALILFSSIVLGIFFLVNSYQYVLTAKAATDKYSKARYIFEAVLTFFYGGYLMVGPDIGLKTFTTSCCVYFLLDAVFEIIHIYRVKKNLYKA